MDAGKLYKNDLIEINWKEIILDGAPAGEPNKVRLLQVIPENGKFDSHRAPVFKDAYAEYFSSSDSGIFTHGFDFGKVVYVDSSGLHAILIAKKKQDEATCMRFFGKALKDVSFGCNPGNLPEIYKDHFLFYDSEEKRVSGIKIPMPGMGINFGVSRLLEISELDKGYLKPYENEAGIKSDYLKLLNDYHNIKIVQQI